jgi:hypothetical protein
VLPDEFALPDGFAPRDGGGNHERWNGEKEQETDLDL